MPEDPSIRERDRLSRLVADATAKALVGDEGRVLVLAAQLGLLPSAAPVGDLGRTMGSPGRIGAWEAVEKDGERVYRRVQSSILRSRADHAVRWADVEEIPRKTERKRYVLLGESVARGYFFDPDFTPAGVLQAILSAAGDGRAEVVDLAATDLAAGELLSMLAKVPALEPDGIVIFAGNNWVGGALAVAAADPANRQLAARALREYGFGGLARFLEEYFVPIVAGTLQLVPTLAKQLGIPFVLVVPEFNVGDWRDPTDMPPWLPADGNRRWWELREAGLSAAAEGRWDDVDAVGAELLKIDGGTTSLGHHLLAQRYRADGNTEGALRSLDAARDCRLWQPMVLTPRCFSSVRRGLLRLACENVSVVDLSSVFRGPPLDIPDRRSFLDYCHLTAEGIRRSMAATAQALLRQPDLGALLAAAPHPEPDTEGGAHFLAAIHNAHHGQPRETTAYHIKRAFELSPRMIDVARAFLGMQGRRAPPPLTSAGRTISDVSEAKALARYLLRFNAEPLLDRDLIDLLADCLADCGFDESARIAGIRTVEWGVRGSASVDLLAHDMREFHSHCWPNGRRNFYRAYAPCSRFALIVEGAAELIIAVTYRGSPRFTPEGSARVCVDASEIGSLELTPGWVTIELRCSARASGVHTIEIHWPLGRWDGEGAIEVAAAELEAGRIESELLPSFADIAAMRCRLGSA